MSNLIMPRSVSAPAFHALGLVVCAVIATSVSAQDKLDLPEDPLAAVAKMPVQEPAKEGQRVEVVDETGKPLAGISVIVVPGMEKFGQGRMEALQRQAEQKYRNDQDRATKAMVVLLGRRFVTSENGSVVIPKLERSGVLMAVRGEDTAIATGREALKEVIRVVLRPDLPIHVLVVGPKGRPAQGVPVAIATSVDHNFGVSRLVKTDKAGLAKLRWGIYRNFPLNRKLFVRAMVATRNPVAQQVDPRKFQNDAEHPIRLALPNYGQVRVYVVDEDDQPVRGIDGATLSIVSRRDRFGGYRSQLEADSVDDDSATFSFVEVGLTVEVSCRYQGSTRPQMVKSDGPRHYMDMRIVKIKNVTAPTRLEFRVLGLDGKPVIDEQLGIIFMQGRSFRGNTARTDGEGRLDIVVANEFAALGEGRFCLVRRFGRSDGKTAFLGAKQLSFESLRRHGGSLGDIRLEEEKLVAAGRVVDQDGKPLSGVRVTVPEIHGDFNSQSRSGSSVFFECRSTTDEAGRFELRALRDDLGSAKVLVSVSGYILDSGDDLEAGSKDAKIVMARASSIHGKLLGMGSSRRFGPTIRLLHEDGSDTQKYAYPSKDATFRFDNCRPGEYSVEFKLDRTMGAFLTIPGLKVEAGKPCKDPRLMNVDLLKYVRIVKITVLGDDKKPLPRASLLLHFVHEGSIATSWRPADENGVCELMFPLEGGNISVRDQDGEYRTQRFPMLKKDVVVQLQRAILVKLRIKGMPVLPENLEFRVTTQRTTPAKPGARTPWGWGDFGDRRGTLTRDARGRTELYVDEPGAYLLTLAPALSIDGGRAKFLDHGRLTFDFTVKKAEQKDPKAQVVEIALEEDGLETVKELIDLAKGR